MLEQETGYPWNGDIRVKVAQGNQEFALKLRIPGWVRDEVLPSDLYSYADNQKPTYRIIVNGQETANTLTPERTLVISFIISAVVDDTFIITD